ncbi:hypothetical protein T05_2185 [Trichinella murrelli]|uniref:Secreted protein n=1 Tax=Trichinella murrelli TaxID=144512 RepID=A0A0V0T5U4_9BILA|nr:hypothetical protein T05_2185 [Trichinella murrelli]
MPFPGLSCPSLRSSWVESVLFLLALCPSHSAPTVVSRQRGCSVFHSHIDDTLNRPAGGSVAIDTGKPQTGETAEASSPNDDCDSSQIGATNHPPSLKERLVTLGACSGNHTSVYKAHAFARLRPFVRTCVYGVSGEAGRLLLASRCTDIEPWRRRAVLVL